MVSIISGDSIDGHLLPATGGLLFRESLARGSMTASCKSMSMAASNPSCRDMALLSDLEGLERRYRNLVDINKHFVEWRCRFGQIEQRVALYRAWDVLPEALQRSVSKPPDCLMTLQRLASDEHDVVLAAAWEALSDYVNRSWRKLKQCVDATMEDIRRRELSAEIELRIIQVQCSPPVMWIIPSCRITLPESVVADVSLLWHKQLACKASTKREEGHHLYVTFATPLFEVVDKRKNRLR